MSRAATTAAFALALSVAATWAVADDAPAPEPAEGTPPAATAPDTPAPAAVPPEALAEGRAAWATIHTVLTSPRCMNCHPAGDVPLQTDASRPHAMNVSRLSEQNGLDCATCHKERNSEALGIVGGPPGAPHWHLPPPETPMVFQGRSPAELCAQLKRPADNGGKTLDALLHHVTHDPLVLWGWDPGGTRTRPPVSHADFVAAFGQWVASGGACPE